MPFARGKPQIVGANPFALRGAPLAFSPIRGGPEGDGELLREWHCQPLAICPFGLKKANNVIPKERADSEGIRGQDGKATEESVTWMAEGAPKSGIPGADSSAPPD